MAKVYYVECPNCKREYYLEKGLYQTAVANPQQILKCPFCKKGFHLKTHEK